MRTKYAIEQNTSIRLDYYLITTCYNIMRSFSKSSYKNINCSWWIKIKSPNHLVRYKMLAYLESKCSNTHRKNLKKIRTWKENTRVLFYSSIVASRDHCRWLPVASNFWNLIVNHYSWIFFLLLFHLFFYHSKANKNTRTCNIIVFETIFSTWILG